MKQSPYHLEYRATRAHSWKRAGVSMKSSDALRKQLRAYRMQLCHDHRLNPTKVELRIVTNSGMEIHRLDRDGDHFGPPKP